MNTAPASNPTSLPTVSSSNKEFRTTTYPPTRALLKMRPLDWEDGSMVKRLSHKHEDQNSDPQNSCKVRCGRTYPQSQHFFSEIRGGDGSLQRLRPVSLASYTQWRAAKWKAGTHTRDCPLTSTHALEHMCLPNSHILT